MDSTQEHRRACEIRRIARMDKDERQAFYLLVTKHRGIEAARELAREVRELIAARHLE